MALRNGKQVINNTVSLQLNDILPAGTLLDFGGTAAPAGFLLCYGQEVSQTTYAALFANIGTTWNTGGEAGGNFRLPDFRGRARVGKDDMGGSAANRVTSAGSGITGTTLGATGGAETHTLTTPQIPSHLHGQTVLTTSGAAVGSQRSSPNSGSENSFNNTQNTGGGGSHNNTQPSAIVNVIIKY